MLFALLSCALAHAQTTPLPTEFPPDAAPIGADALRERLSGKVFRARIANGDGWRMQYMTNGYFFINTDRGFADDGKWRTEDGRFCTELKKVAASCAETRIKGDRIYFKRTSNGEVVEMKVQ